MKYRTLGDNLKVSALGVGCMPMGGGGDGVYGAGTKDETVATLHRAIDLGVTFFDTAEVYGPHVNEQLLGDSIKGKRDGLIIATKFGFTFDDNGGVRGLDSTPQNIRRACEGSLKRLGIDTIDLYYQHRVDPNVPIEEVMGVLVELKREGKIRHMGLSEAGVATIRRANAVHPVAAIQSEYSLWEREVENDILPLCRELNIGLVPFSPLGRGFLTGQITKRSDLAADDFRLGDPRYSEENFAANLKIVDAVKDIAAKHGVSGGQIALAWLLAQGDGIAPIPGFKRRATLEDSMAAIDVTLDADDLATLDKAAPLGGTAGPRYGEKMMAMTRL
ncbi:aldo/keto reductase [Sphingobium phenoxybenzoativorans]|uniref:Aldo/keto reductase n=1 Tax=Sphingobium phenoxybenzoativorans TaxID=1592790 RepID=A0A975K9S1_9SPHN|nr:aldo/keto reductase [Sphingobium phenoxybenzoativorans]QUT06648.1 aldo/keto reductase [Sphingobium phenoxybenzoativorans]